jgi:muramoyltetrapeptide carboxypeptidase
VLERLGFDVRLGPHVLGRRGYLAGTDPGARARPALVVGAQGRRRGLLRTRRLRHGPHRRRAHAAFLRRHPKVFCGFSDINDAPCRLRARRPGLVLRADGGVGPGARRGPAARLETSGRQACDPTAISKSGGFDEASLRAMLMESARDVVIARPPSRRSCAGRATGRLVGRLPVDAGGDARHPEEVDTSGSILVLEDEKEPPYRIDRMLTPPAARGKLDRVRGIVLGDFPECQPAGYELVDLLRDRLGDLACRSRGASRSATRSSRTSRCRCSHARRSTQDVER